MIGHAVAFAPRPAGRIVWNRWIAIGFAVGSAWFLVGPFPGLIRIVGARQDNRLVWAPDPFGSAAFLISGARAFDVARRAHRHAARRDPRPGGVQHPNPESLVPTEV
jgi:hypothetical protein